MRGVARSTAGCRWRDSGEADDPGEMPCATDFDAPGAYADRVPRTEQGNPVGCPARRTAASIGQRVLCTMVAGAVLALAACAGAGGWRQVDTVRPIIVVTGRIVLLDAPQQGDVRIEIVPGPGDGYALAPGQRRLMCILHARDRAGSASSVLQLRVGTMVRVTGYWTTRDEPRGVRYYISEATSVRIAL
jgi:hypothetical protein